MDMKKLRFSDVAVPSVIGAVTTLILFVILQNYAQNIMLAAQQQAIAGGSPDVSMAFTLILIGAVLVLPFGGMLAAYISLRDSKSLSKSTLAGFLS